MSEVTPYKKHVRSYPYCSERVIAWPRETIKVRVLFRHSLGDRIPKRIVKSGCQISTIRFGTSGSKSKSGSQFSTIRFGTSAPKRKAEVKFRLFVLELTLQIKKRKSTSHNSFWNSSTFRFGINLNTDIFISTKPV